MVRCPLPTITIALTTLTMLTALSASCRGPYPRSEEKSPRGFALPEGDVQKGREALVSLRCNACHEVAGLENELPRPVATPQTDVKLGGPRHARADRRELVTSIVNPSHAINPAEEKGRITSDDQSRMANLNETMTIQNLIDLATFLHERYETVPSGGE